MPMPMPTLEMTIAKFPPFLISFKKRPRTYETDKNSLNYGLFINYGTFSQFNSFLNLVLLLGQSKSQFRGQD